MRIKTMWSVTQSAMWDWWNDNCMRLSASLAFYTALSLAPLVMIVVGVAGLITERQLVADQLEQQIGLLMGQPSRQVVHTILTTTEPQGGSVAAMIGIVTLVIGATAVFGELQAALNLIWEVKPKPIDGVWANLWLWLRQRFFSLAIVLAIAFLLLVSLVISAALAGVTHYLQGPELTRMLLSRVLEVASRFWSSHSCSHCSSDTCRTPRFAGAMSGWAAWSQPCSLPLGRWALDTTSAAPALARLTVRRGR